MKTHHKIIIGDARRMGEVGNESIQLVVTSPPYWQLKDYGNSNQIGYNHSYEEYINNLNLVWNDCWRILEPGCRLCINIGDQFARSVYYGRYKIIPIRTEIIKFCETAGFDYMGAVIWQKVTTCNTTGGATIMGSFPYPRNGILKLDYEFILIFKKPGKAKPVSREIRERSKLTINEWNQYFTGHWNFGGEKQSKHLAMFPEELPKRLIKMFTFIDDTVLDPFLGSGTTILAAKNYERNSIGYEINADYLPLIKEKIGYNKNLLDEEATFEVIDSTQQTVESEKAIEMLPYIFRDIVRFDKKVDPKILNFGSRVDHTYNPRKEYLWIREIENPEIMVLSNGLKVRLLGVKHDLYTKEKATNYLIELTKGQSVFLKFDETKFDSDNRLLCYLYLKNKTFINAHLIKQGLAQVDTSIDFKYLDKFLKLQSISYTYNER